MSTFAKAATSTSFKWTSLTVVVLVISSYHHIQSELQLLNITIKVHIQPHLIVRALGEESLTLVTGKCTSISRQKQISTFAQSYSERVFQFGTDVIGGRGLGWPLVGIHPKLFSVIWDASQNIWSLCIIEKVPFQSFNYHGKASFLMINFIIIR